MNGSVAWFEMTDKQQFQTLESMHQKGGGFASHLSEAWQRADSTNSIRLALAFPDLIAKYRSDFSSELEIDGDAE